MAAKARTGFGELRRYRRAAGLPRRSWPRSARAVSATRSVARGLPRATLLIPVWMSDNVPFGTQAAERWDTYAAWMTGRGLIPPGLNVSAAWRGDLATGLSTPVA